MDVLIIRSCNSSAKSILLTSYSVHSESPSLSNGFQRDAQTGLMTPPPPYFSDFMSHTVPHSIACCTGLLAVHLIFQAHFCFRELCSYFVSFPQMFFSQMPMWLACSPPSSLCPIMNLGRPLLVTLFKIIILTHLVPLPSFVFLHSVYNHLTQDIL